MSWLVIIAVLIIGGAVLYGCAQPSPTNSVVVSCIPLKNNWTYDDMAQLQKEYDALPPNATMRTAFKDYIAMRDADRNCLRGSIQ